MPNNASARRGKDKKNKDKKKTDTLPLPKKDAASVDSGTLSLSSAGLDKSSKDKASSLPCRNKGGQDKGCVQIKQHTLSFCCRKGTSQTKIFLDPL